mmetsp:Transcript_16844/g.23584  ORF Transcript_16844/g.23584 Transcript_16844/m.23584 type:complete len:371 (-) Transcript_16844:218-1330(-)
MSKLAVPPAFKSLKKYLSQARALDKVHPVAAYYCRYQFLQKGFAMPKEQRDADAGKFLGDLLTELERAKSTLPSDKSEKQKSIQAFALNVFRIADDEDRAGNASKQTAVKFRTSSILFEVSELLGELSEDVQEKLRYARWKQVDILKAIKEGRKPTPGPPGGLEEELEKMNAEEEVEAKGPSGMDATLYYRSGEENAGADNRTSKNSEAEGSVEADPMVQQVESDPMVQPVEAVALLVKSDDAGQDRSRGTDAEVDAVMRYLNAKTEPRRADQTRTTPILAQPSAPPSIPAQEAKVVYSDSGYSNYKRAGDSNAIVVRAIATEDKISAQIQAERLMGHAQSALRFHDVDGAIEKMKGALAVLIPYAGNKD